MIESQRTRAGKRDKLEAQRAVTDGFIYRFLEGIDTPRSLAIKLLYESGEHDQLVDMPIRFDCDRFVSDKVTPSGFGGRGAYDAALDYVATEFLSKADFLKLNRDRKQLALEKFQAAEGQCRESNKRLLSVNATDHSHVGVEALHWAKRKISEILGAFDPLEFIEKVNWGPGATAGLTRLERLAYDKFRLERGMSADCLSFWTSHGLFAKAFPRWTPELKEEIAYVTTVPKNSKIDRTIIVEPGINTFFQKALGSMIRSRLARHGINLRYQADHHAALVRTMGLDGALATVDFSAASDTICRQLVWLLLPEDWHRVLDVHRSKHVDFEGQVIGLEKFSSMGNGFTFELESLIFYVLAKAVCNGGEKVSVFGDDVILPSHRVDAYREVCTYAGLTLNARKSFSTGYFRESCGAHSFGTCDAKPLFLREKIRSIHDVLKMANQLRRLSERFGLNWPESKFRRAWSHLTGVKTRDKLNHRYNVGDFKIPEGVGDFGLLTSFDEACPVYHRRYQGGWRLRFLVPSFSEVRIVEDDALLWCRLFDLRESMIVEEFRDEWDSSFDALALRNSLSHGNEVVDLHSRIRVRVSEAGFVHEWNNPGFFLPGR